MKDKTLRIIPLGGLGEVGRNMMLYEYSGQILVVDAGMMSGSGRHIHTASCSGQLPPGPPGELFAMFYLSFIKNLKTSLSMSNFTALL